MIAIAASSRPKPLSTSTISFSALVSGLLGCKGGPRPQNLWNLLKAARAIEGTNGSIHTPTCQIFDFTLSAFLAEPFLRASKISPLCDGPRSRITIAVA